MHDHAAVGPADEAPPALAAGGQHELAQRGAAGEPAEAEGEQRRAARRRRRATATPSAPAPHHAGQNSRSRSSSPLALRHGSTGATAMRNSSASPIGIVMRSKYGAPTDDAGGPAAPRRSAGTRCRAARRRRTRRTARCWRGTRPRARAASRSRPGERSRSPRQPMSANDTATTSAEERRAGTAPIGAVAERVHARRARRERVRNVPRIVSAERGAQQRQVPDAQHPAALLHHHRVDVRGAGEPRQEAGVLDRVPAPSTPPQPSTS